MNESRIGRLEGLIHIRSLHEWMNLTKRSVTSPGDISPQNQKEKKKTEMKKILFYPKST